MHRMILNCLGIAGAGAVGALARFAVSQGFNWMVGNAFPWGTLFINVGGAFALGWVNTAFGKSSGGAATLQLALGVGFLGAYTTFSSMMWESDYITRNGNIGRTVAYLALSLVLGLIAVRLGYYVGSGAGGGGTAGGGR